jgi:hypothetical protein
LIFGLDLAFAFSGVFCFVLAFDQDIFADPFFCVLELGYRRLEVVVVVELVA